MISLGQFFLTRDRRSKPQRIELISSVPVHEHPDIMCEPNSPWLAIEYVPVDSVTGTVRLWTCLPEHLVPA